MKKNISLFIIGFICGGLLLNFLSINAIKVHKRIIRSGLEAEQQMLAQRAEREGDYMQALVHRWNVVGAASQEGFRVFRPETSKGVDVGFIFPFQAIILSQIFKAADPQGKGKRVNDGLQRAQLALTMEKVGMVETAAEQWKKAAELIPMEIDRLKKMTLGSREKIYSDLSKEAERVILDE